MARGWESKSVEQQQEESQRDRTRAAAEAVSEEQRARADRRRTLEMAIARTQQELQAACHPRHKDMLRLKLEAVQKELDALKS